MAEIKYSESDFESWDKSFRTNFINSLGGFKSINLIGSVDDNGNPNLSIVSSVFHVGANPPYVGVLFRPPVVERHTLDNILETNFFTLNHLNEQIYKSAHQASAKYPREVSEFEACNLTPEYSKLVVAPYVLESKIKIGLKLVDKIDIKLNGTVLIIGQIVETILDNEFIGEDGYIDIEKGGTLTSSGLDGYHKTIKVGRLSYAKVGQEVKQNL